MTAKKSPASRKTARSTRTKADLEEEVEELRARLDDAPELSPQAEVLAKEHIKEVRQAVKGALSIEQIITDGAQFGLRAQQTVTGITEQIAAKAQELKTIQDAIVIEETELARLYDLDVAAASVKALIENHEQRKEELETEMTQARAAWSEEVQAHTKATIQRNAELAQTRKREEDEYAYKTKQERQKANDEFAQNMLIQTREQADRVNRIESQLAERQQAIADQEGTIKALETRFAGLEDEIDNKTKAAVAIATNSLKKDLTSQFQLEKKDLEMNLKVLEQQKIAVDQANEKLAAQVVQLTGQLDAARAQVIEVSNNALASASGQVALTAVRETVKENGQQGGGRKS